MIPVLIVPVLNRPDLLDEMMKSIDHEIGRIVVIDNGHLYDSEHRPYLRSDVINLPHNLGVAASWNLGMKVTPQAPWWLIVNSDIAFGAGDLNRLVETVDSRAAALYLMSDMAAFAITRRTLKVVGMFDEGFINAYNEDLDYARRCHLADVPRVQVGFTGTHVGSATIGSDPVLQVWNNTSHNANDAYYTQKWGGAKQGGETYETPFNRQGHLGEWQFDFDRYRAMTWPRTE